MSFREAIDLVAELKREFGSHLNADLLGWDFAAGYGEVMSVLLTSAYMNAHRDPKKQPDPVVLLVPWPDKNANADVTPEERMKLREQLLRRSAFAEQ